MKVTFRPIEQWPTELTPKAARRATPFYSSYDESVDLMIRELGYLDATDVVLEIATRDVRRDGTGPLSNARADHPGVILSFGSKYGPLRYWTDEFTHWWANYRAIALALEALRKVDRYGVSNRGEQYTGWAALPSAGESTDVAATVIADAAHVTLDEVRADPKAAVRQAQVRTHPDRGGDPAQFQRVTEMAEVLLR